MLEKIKKWLIQLFTEADNKTADLTKVLAMPAIVDGLALASYAVVVQKAAFSFQDFGTGVGILFAGLGVVLGFKKESNDKPYP